MYSNENTRPFFIGCGTFYLRKVMYNNKICVKYSMPDNTGQHSFRRNNKGQDLAVFLPFTWLVEGLKRGKQRYSGEPVTSKVEKVMISKLRFKGCKMKLITVERLRYNSTYLFLEHTHMCTQTHKHTYTKGVGSKYLFLKKLQGLILCMYPLRGTFLKVKQNISQ